MRDVTTGGRRVVSAVATVGLAFALVLIGGAAHADHVAEIGPNPDDGIPAGTCVVGEESFVIPDRGEFFGVRLTTTTITKDVVQGERTLVYRCEFSGVPTFLDAYDPAGPEEQPGTVTTISSDYTVPKGGFTSSVSCWDRFNPGMVEGTGTIKVTHKGTAVLSCDLRAAYAAFDAGTP
jgi:hypothetical protein